MLTHLVSMQQEKYNASEGSAGFYGEESGSDDLTPEHEYYREAMSLSEAEAAEQARTIRFR